MIEVALSTIISLGKMNFITFALVSKTHTPCWSMLNPSKEQV
jgi:hypothetical protein